MVRLQQETLQPGPPTGIAVRLATVDSHTCGQMTRVVVDGAPALEGLSAREARDVLSAEHDWIRRLTVLEPRGGRSMFAAILRIPFAILVPLIVFVCAIGAYTVSNSMLDVWYMLGFGVLGYVFKKLDYPLAPLVLALVLGDMAESALRQTLIMSQGSIMIFAQRPIAVSKSV